MISLPNLLHSSTSATGITLAAPLYNAVAIVVVARKTSIITTTVFCRLNKWRRAGEREVKSVGFLSMRAKIKA
jgi:hypothetical protein